jgi:hypothetical protein
MRRLSWNLATGVAAACLGCAQPGPVDDFALSVQIPAGSITSASCGATYEDQATTAGNFTSYSCAPGLSFSGREWVRSLTVGSAGDVVISTANTSDYGFIAVLRDDGTGTIDSEACLTGNYYAVRFPAQAGEKFYVVVDSAAADLTFDVKIECAAGSTEATCGDGFDNDGDYKTDCDDTDCASVTSCAARCQPASTLSCGQKLVSANTYGFGSTDLVDSYSCPSQSAPDGRERGFTFTAPSSGPVVFTLSNFFGYPMIYVMESDGSCNPNKCLAFNYYSVRWNAVAGKTYHIVTDGNGTGTYSYMASLICDAPTTESTCDDNIDEDGDFLIDCADQDCAAAVACGTGSCSTTEAMTCDTRRLPGDTATAPPAVVKMWNYACAPSLSLSGPERVYSLPAVNKATDMLVTLSNMSTYGWVGIIEERSNSCGPTACIAGNYYSVKFTAQKGKKYYAVVEGDFAPSIKYEVSTICSPPPDEDWARNGCTDQIDNDGDTLIDCADPNCYSACRSGRACWPVADITCSTKLLADTTTGGTNEISGYSCFQATGQNGNERTYKFVATESGFVNFTTSDRSNYASVLVMEDQGGGCDANRCVGFQYYSNLMQVTAGKTYYVVVDSPQSGGVDYKLSVVCNPSATETTCDDNIDNDADFLIDTADPDCQ